MDFHSFSRRALQTLCKKNRIPANMTNIAMADALRALPTVEGLDEIQETQQLQTPYKAAMRSPNPIRSCRRSSAVISKGSNAKKRVRGEGNKESPSASNSWKSKRTRSLSTARGSGKKEEEEKGEARKEVIPYNTLATCSGLRRSVQRVTETEEKAVCLKTYYRRRQSSREQSEGKERDIAGVVLSLEITEDSRIETRGHVDLKSAIESLSKKKSGEQLTSEIYPVDTGDLIGGSSGITDQTVEGKEIKRDPDLDLRSAEFSLQQSAGVIKDQEGNNSMAEDQESQELPLQGDRNILQNMVSGSNESLLKDCWKESNLDPNSEPKDLSAEMINKANDESSNKKKRILDGTLNENWKMEEGRSFEEEEEEEGRSSDIGHFLTAKTPEMICYENLTSEKESVDDSMLKKQIFHAASSPSSGIPTPDPNLQIEITESSAKIPDLTGHQPIPFSDSSRLSSDATNSLVKISADVRDQIPTEINKSQTLMESDYRDLMGSKHISSPDPILHSSDASGSPAKIPVEIKDLFKNQQTSSSDPSLRSSDDAESRATVPSAVASPIANPPESDSTESPAKIQIEIENPVAKPPEPDSDLISGFHKIGGGTSEERRGEKRGFVGIYREDGEGADVDEENLEAKSGGGTKGEMKAEKQSAKKRELDGLSLRRLRLLYKEKKEVKDKLGMVTKMGREGGGGGGKVQKEAEKQSAQKRRIDGLSLRKLKLIYKEKVSQNNTSEV